MIQHDISNGLHRIVMSLLILAACVLAGRITFAVDVKAEFDKTFDFAAVRTWGWNPEGPGEVRMARTLEDDPDAMRKRAEPVIVDAVSKEMSRLGLRPATMPDVEVTYYLLLTIGTSAQEVGQFLPATPMWGVPPFAPATQSLEFMNRGSLVLDLSARGTIVWRGLAEAKIRLDADDRKRETLIRESVRDLLRRYPRRH